jgi:hypothetical protein
MGKVIVVLGGGLAQDKTGKWHTLGPEDAGDKFGVSFDRWRVIAGAHLWKGDKTQTVVASGGRGQYADSKDVHTPSSVLRRELIDLGVAPERIIEEDQSGNTFAQLTNIIPIVKNFSLINFVSNEWHLPRIRAMIDHVEDLAFLRTPSVNLISAEEVLLQSDVKQWEYIIERARNSHGIQKRIELEEKGVKQIREGTYRFKRQ